MNINQEMIVMLFFPLTMAIAFDRSISICIILLQPCFSFIIFRFYRSGIYGLKSIICLNNWVGCTTKV